MQTSNRKVFISYSWDSTEHQRWVINLTNDLRRKGINALNDVFITQSDTVNLDLMMVSQIRDSDYTIIVLTEDYAKKADEVKGGVGFETVLTLSYVRENLSKLILIMRHNGDYTKAFPFHLKDVSAIDFSCDDEYKTKLEELVYKICNIPLYEMEPIGPVPDLKPKVVSKLGRPNNDSSIIPKLKKTTDMEKSQFLQDAYNQMLVKFKSLFEQTKQANEEFTYVYEQITSRKSVFRAYVNGSIRTSMKIWYGSAGWTSEGIYFSYGNFISENSDNSYNEMILCETSNDNTLQLRQTMNLYSRGGNNDVETIVRGIWVNHIKCYIEG